MHKIKVQKQIGNQYIEIIVEGANPEEALQELAKWSFSRVKYCPFCEARRNATKGAPEDYARHLDLQSRKAKDKFNYSFVKCLRCGAELTFGKTTTGDKIYFRTDDNGKLDWKQLNKK